MRVIRTFALLVAISVCAHGQNPYKMAPDNYRLEFENEYTRVSRATLRPGEKIPTHDHPTSSTVYVYLTDGGPARFIHDSPSFSVERPAVKAGGIRINRATKETHRVEYLGSKESEYLRIELRNDPPLSQRTTRIAPDEAGTFENAKIRIRRVSCVEPTNCVAEFPTVAVSIDQRTSHWLSPGQIITNEADKAPLIFVEFKTRD